MAAFELNTRLFLNALEGVSDDEAVRRPNDRINSMSFIAAHLVDVRHYTLAYLGASSHNPLATLLRDVGSIDDVRALPDIEKLRSYWREVSRELESCIAGIGDETLMSASSQSFPIDDATVLGGIQFLLHHEAYHIGQLALLRKHHGHAAMSYR